MSPPRTFTVLMLVISLTLFILAGFGAIGSLSWVHWQALGWWGGAALAASLLPF